MRYIVIAILIYCLYLFLKYLLKLYLNSINRRKPKGKTSAGRFRSKKIDLNNIEEADYEEVTTPKSHK
jgi:hypothetical protein